MKNEATEFAVSMLAKKSRKLKKAIELLDVADCPECKTKDGVYYKDWKLVKCQWCDEVSKLRDEL